mgnify:CR=1 FL=1
MQRPRVQVDTDLAITHSRDREKGKRSETAHGTTLRRMRYRFSLEIPLSHPPEK